MKRALFGLACLPFVFGCHSSEPPQAPAAPIQGISIDDQSRCDYRGRADREVSESTGATSPLPNIRRVYGIVGEGEERRRVLLCREVDSNFDGVKDNVRTYNDKGEPVSELVDSNFDGRIDTWTFFTRGRVSKVQFDRHNRGQPDETRFYVGTKLSRAQRDTNGDGKPDVWEVYDDGKLQRVGVDIDFDGHVDRWDRDEVALREAAEQERREAARPPVKSELGSSSVAGASGTQ